MREIKFRGLRLDGKGWIYGDLVNQTTNAHSKIIDVGIKEHQCHPVEVKPSSVSQYTGLKDKEGKEIYEGSICRIRFYDEGLKNGQVVFRVFHSGYYLEGDFGQYSMGTWEPSYIEIIGNIHENPELLNQ